MRGLIAARLNVLTRMLHHWRIVLHIESLWEALVTGYFIMSCAKFDLLAKVTIARFLHLERYSFHLCY